MKVVIAFAAGMGLGTFTARVVGGFQVSDIRKANDTFRNQVIDLKAEFKSCRDNLTSCNVSRFERCQR